MKNTNHSTSGFTLTELLVSISIIGTLLGILLPVLAIAKAKANRIKCVNNVSHVGKALLAFAADNNERMPWQLGPIVILSTRILMFPVTEPSLYGAK